MTIEHLPDWLGLKRENTVATKAELRVLTHFANGQKHHHGLRKSHRSVDGTAALNSYAEDYADDYTEERLIIYVTVDEAGFIGADQIDACELARRALTYWRPFVPDL